MAYVQSRFGWARYDFRIRKRNAWINKIILAVYTGVAMITIKTGQRTLSVLVSRALLVGMALPLPMSAFATTQHLKPIEPVNIQEAAPPWDGGQDQLAVEAAAALEKETRQQQAQTTAPAAAPEADAPDDTRVAEPETDTPAPPTVASNNASSADAAPSSSGGSAMEKWYRSRQQKSANPADDLNPILEAARRGDAQAQYQLAMRYRNSEGGGNLSQSLKWQRQSAMGGNAEAQYGLGLLYANGQYLPRDPQQASFWFQKAASQGHVAARLELLSQNSGTVAASVPAPAQPPVKVASVAPATFEVPESKSAPVAESAPVQTAAAKTSSADGVAPADLTGVEPDVVKQSAEQGDANAQLMLGTLYEDGVGGLPSDLRLAAKWYEKSAKQGYTKAQYNLALLYEDGRGVDKDYKQAAYWYEKAANAGFSEAQNNLGLLYILGNGVKKDQKRAKQLFSASAAQGNADAARNLQMLQTG
jgi:TPR repeat protein